MFGLSFTHLVILGVLALVFLGPEQLPEVARTLARLLNEWKRATGDLQSSLTNTLREENLWKPNPPPPSAISRNGAQPQQLDAKSEPIESQTPLPTTDEKGDKA